MPDQDIVEFLLDRINCLENRFETRFDRLETQLDRWMEKNGDQNISIEKNTNRIESIYQIIDRRNRRFLTITVAMASCIATLLSAFIQVLVKCVF